MKDSLQWMLDKFPFFLNKSTGSNFYKSTSVLNENFKDLFQELFNVHLSHRLEKRVLIWKEQGEPYEYTMNFYVHLPSLKRVNVYKNSELIYTESYNLDDEADTFIYSYDDISDKVIPSDKYRVAVETWEEYVIRKGFPENDTRKGDVYDHDPSLDDLGALYDIPRKVYVKSSDYENTEPLYSNRLSEDDYHYMNRILGYLTHMMDTPLPVLEVWKLFGISLDKISLVNRERYLCKMYSSTRHGGDDWTPLPWEHKDTMHCPVEEPVLFFVEVDNHSPAYGQSVNFSFVFLDIYGEAKSVDYLIDVYLDDDLIEEDVKPEDGFVYSTVDVDDSAPLVFRFIANPLKDTGEVLESDDIIITVRGCSSADWYVATDGNDNNPGTINAPFLTLGKALSMVEGSKNSIVLKQGTFTIGACSVIDCNTSIISCQGAEIANTVSPDFFEVRQGYNLYLQGVDLVYSSLVMESGDGVSFFNRNIVDTSLFVRVRYDGGSGLHVWSNDLTKYQGGSERFEVRVTEDGEPVSSESVVFTWNGQTYNRTTDSNGKARISINVGPGEYPISFTVREIEYTNNIIVLPRFIGEDVTKYEHGSQVYTCTVLDDTGTPVSSGTSVNVNIDSVTSEYSTNSRGVITVPLEQAPGDYVLTVTYDGLLYSNSVSILPRLIAADLTKYEMCTEQFLVEVFDENGEHVPDGTIISFDFHIVHYTRQTNNGFVIFNIDVPPGEYSMITSYADVTPITNTVKVLPRLTASDLVMTYGDGSTFNAYLVDCDGNPQPYETIRFNINGDISRVVTDTGGVARLPITLPVGSYQISTSYGVLSQIQNTIVVNDGGYSLSISASSSSIDCGESVILTGTLLHESTPYASQSIQLYDGNTLIDTVNTDNNGEYEKTITGLTVGTHTFKAVNTNATSSNVSVTVNIISTSTSISASSSSITYGESVTLSGGVTGGATGSVKLYDGSTLIATESLSNGAYSKSVSGLSVGSHSLKAVYQGDNCHSGSESSMVTVTVSEPAPVHDYSLSVASTKDILSYADSESATLTATLKDNGSAVSGETLSYTIKHGSTTITTGSGTTNSNGQITFTYASSGIGDVTIEVDFGILLQETYAIEDCWKYIANPSSCSSCNISLPSKAIISYKISKPTVTGYQGGVNIQLTDSSHTYFVGNWASDGTNGLLIRNTGSSSNLVDQRCTGISANTEYLMGITYNEGSWTYFKDNEVKSFSANYTPTTINIIQIQQGYMKELKIKAL